MVQEVSYSPDGFEVVCQLTPEQSSHNPLLSVPSVGALPLGGSHNVALEILQGNDENLDVGDFMGGERPVAEVLDVNSVMEKSRRM